MEWQVNSLPCLSLPLSISHMSVNNLLLFYHRENPTRDTSHKEKQPYFLFGIISPKNINHLFQTFSLLNGFLITGRGGRGREGRSPHNLETSLGLVSLFSRSDDIGKLGFEGSTTDESTCTTQTSSVPTFL